MCYTFRQREVSNHPPLTKGKTPRHSAPGSLLDLLHCSGERCVLLSSGTSLRFMDWRRNGDQTENHSPKYKKYSNNQNAFLHQESCLLFFFPSLCCIWWQSRETLIPPFTKIDLLLELLLVQLVNPLRPACFSTTEPSRYTTVLTPTKALHTPT